MLKEWVSLTLLTSRPRGTSGSVSSVRTLKAPATLAQPAGAVLTEKAIITMVVWMADSHLTRAHIQGQWEYAHHRLLHMQDQPEPSKA
jgi:hypothetical protein